ncbi:MAG: type II secretory pathway pseudopilin PulG [Verrucomicrobiales bacterium]|jgi:type II secretory pathway pseudopilin PulG
MTHSIRKYKRSSVSGISLIEAVLAIAILGVVAAIAFTSTQRVNEGSQLTKLRSDITTLNQAIEVYISNGGDLTGITNPQAVIDKLKTRRTAESDAAFAGFGNSMIDKRLQVRLQTSAEASSDDPRAVWNPSSIQFEIGTSQVPTPTSFDTSSPIYQAMEINHITITETDEAREDLGIEVEVDAGTNFDATADSVDYSSAEFSSAESASAELSVAEEFLPGIAAFELNDALAAIDFGEELRADAMIDLNADDGWIWVYQDAEGEAPPGPTVVPITPVSGDPPDPVTPPGRLIQPTLNPSPGTYPGSNFPLGVAIGNPNDPAFSDLFWATDWSNGGGLNWQPYVSPVSIQPGQQLLTYVKSTDPAYLDSYSTGGVYDASAIALSAPEIIASASQLDLDSNEPVSISLNDTNPSGTPLELQVRLPGGSWTAYTGAFDVLPQDYSAGFTIEAKTVATTPAYTGSPVSNLTLPIKLSPPEIALSDPAFTPTITQITVTLTNTNPSGSSTSKYKVTNLDDGSETSWIAYSAPFVLDATSYLEGFTVTAFNEPDQPNYIASDEVESDAGFFGIEVDGFTIFVLDVSGSMSWNDRIGQMKAEVVNTLNNYDPNGKFAIVKFSGSASTVVPWQDATPSNVTSAIAAVNGLSAGGSTNYSDALDDSLTIIQAEGDVGQVIFLSDGKPTSGDKSTAGILNRVTNIVNEGAYLDTIGFQINSSGQVLLQSMANSGNGTFIQID